MMRTMAPKDLDGRLCLNCARTNPELPVIIHNQYAVPSLPLLRPGCIHTVCSCDLAPDDSDLGSSDFLLAAVDVCDALAQVEGCGLGVVDALNLDERCVWVGVALSSLVRKVLSPVSSSVSTDCFHIMISPLCLFRWWESGSGALVAAVW